MIILDLIGESMKVIDQTDDEFIVELEFEKIHWWQKIWVKIYDCWRRRKLNVK